jgi:hypothetical protein
VVRGVMIAQRDQYVSAAINPASGITMLRHTSSVAARNGLVVGTTFPAAILKPLMDRRDDYLPCSVYE